MSERGEVDWGFISAAVAVTVIVLGVPLLVGNAVSDVKQSVARRESGLVTGKEAMVPGVSRFVDKEMGVACYVYSGGSAMSCVALDPRGVEVGP